MNGKKGSEPEGTQNNSPSLPPETVEEIATTLVKKLPMLRVLITVFMAGFACGVTSAYTMLH
jgi:hypothetical protein